MAAIDVMLAACQTGDAVQCVEAGRLLRDGTEVPADPKRASWAFQRACTLGSPVGCEELAVVEPAAPPPPDDAEDSDIGSVLSLSLDRLWVSDPDAIGGVENALVFAIRGQTFSFAPPAIGTRIDLVLGGARGGGFVYDVDLLVGPGKWFGRRVGAAVMVGLEVDGIGGGRMPFGFGAPVELACAANLAERLTVQAHGRAAWIVYGEDRRDGASFADVLRAGGGLYVGRRTPPESEEPFLPLYVGGEWVETMGTTGFHVSVGFGSVDQPP